MWCLQICKNRKENLDFDPEKLKAIKLHSCNAKYCLITFGSVHVAFIFCVSSLSPVTEFIGLEKNEKQKLTESVNR